MVSRWRGRLPVYLLLAVVAGSGPPACRRSHSPTEGYVRWGAGAYQSTCYPAWF